MTLVICPACNRHARGNACPFCKGPLRAYAIGAVSPHLARAALLIASAATVAACHNAMVQPYGAPIVPTDASDIPDASPD